jgi:SAM-dependent methyltransferase
MLDRERLDVTLSGGPVDFARRVRTYVGEADFFSSVLTDDLRSLPLGSSVIEVGCGVGLLALMVAQSGFRVVAYEPESKGFSQMTGIRRMLIDHWDGPLPPVTWVNEALEKGSADSDNLVPYAYAVNVVEHVPNIPAFLDGVLAALTPKGRFRFICPNYLIPYEPHFNIPTLFSKRLTRRVMGRAILGADVMDNEGLWEELSWPTVRMLKREMRRSRQRYEFSADGTRAYLGRALYDNAFLERKGSALSAGFRMVGWLGPKVVGSVPKSALPIIDCTVWRSHN